MHSTVRQAWTQHAARIVGEDNLALDIGELTARGWDGPSPQAIAYPASREEICELVRLALAERLCVIPAGGFTKQRMGGVPQAADLVISLRRMNRITDYQPADLTISVEAGLPFHALESAARAQGQMLPLDVPFATESTLGGIIATNSSGPRRLAYGTARDMVLGIHFVTAEGKLAKCGGKVVKNVAGYDLSKLLIGSSGSLAIISDITFRLFPVPPASITLVKGFPDLTSAVQARDRILHSVYTPQAMEMLDAAASAFVPQGKLLSSPFSLLVRVAGPDAVLERTQEELPSLVGNVHSGTTQWLSGEDESKLWQGLQELTPALLRAHPNATQVKVSALLSKTGVILEAVSWVAAINQLSSAVLAMKLNDTVGGLWLNGLQPR